MEEDVRRYAGSVCRGPAGAKGELVGPFAKLGKCKVRFPEAEAYLPGEQVIIELRDM